METLLRKSCEVIKEAGKSLKNAQVPSARAGDREKLVQQFRAINAFSTHIIRAGLLTIAPDIPWSDAEFDTTRQKDPALGRMYWVCDPMDGAIHFLQGFSPWCISLVLMENGSAAFSIVYDPVRDEMFTALRGQGAWLNGEKLRVNVRNTIQDAILATAHPNQPLKEKKETTLLLTSLGKLLPKAGAVRMLGPSSLQLAYVAAGRLDAFWEYGADVYDWLAGALMVEEAGGKVQTIVGEAFGLETNTGILAGNEELVGLLEEEMPVEWDIFSCKM
ncbi:inositol monophosphatase family protein [Chitinophaga ginsengisoli]|uniref:Myo-inositol-1(Or 4)-monophosphatase n=1 Tax=Chitinophaga ginsengisoli TaxID=363837 RepID=A0A2P8GDE9_9BACT|nr:inositol monophosphatase family protein [Chitinophaga ginsengisoli]PSL31966.1 myo-inositol-1(or 4)-monophosphatase [Chitinophaga ginsengisoli]